MYIYICYIIHIFAFRDILRCRMKNYYFANMPSAFSNYFPVMFYSNIFGVRLVLDKYSSIVKKRYALGSKRDLRVVFLYTLYFKQLYPAVT